MLKQKSIQITTKLIIIITIFINLHQINTLTCSNLEDHSQDLVQCVTVCPINTVNHLNKCLKSRQYIVNNEVHQCNGVVSQDKLTCCKQEQYIYQGQCLKCSGILINNLCCPYGTYADISGNQTKCVKITTGLCSGIKMNDPIKFCCGATSYNIKTKICTSNTGLSCDNSNRFCCPFDQKIQFVGNQPVCTSQCSWKSGSDIFCLNQKCSQNETIINVSPKTFYENQQNPTSNLVAFNNQCCYGLGINNQCFKTQIQCGNRALNKGWSICCGFGAFYNITAKKCSSQCNGIILFETLCIDSNFILDYRGSQPVLMNSTSLCNGKTLPASFPVCCPFNFYLNFNQGCKYCPTGKIFKITTSQVCCLSNEYFDKQSQTCQHCDGLIDHKGMLCCKKDQYIDYSNNGIASCKSTCSNDNIFQSKYCCQSLTDSSCTKTSFKSSLCSPNYFFSYNSCNVCPKLCSSNDQFCIETSNSIDGCSPFCFPGQIFSSNLCLACSQSCQSCSAPFSQNDCISCSSGYTKLSNTCARCSIQCKTCSTSASNCTSCKQSSSLPILLNGKCIPGCNVGQFYTTDSNTCTTCSTACLTCIGGTTSDCTKCNSGQYLLPSSNQISGSCQACNTQCLQCFGNSGFCLSCKNSSYKLDPTNNTCSLQCNTNLNKFQFFSQSLQHSLCLNCHTSCNGCQFSAQNCISCKDTSNYKNLSLGINLCLQCVQPCVSCQSYYKCTACDTKNGFYLSLNTVATQLNCLKCFANCKTCSGPQYNNCLTCHGDATLTSNKQCNGCSTSCLACSQTNTSVCVKCQSSKFLYLNSCVNQCPIRTYFEKSASTCIKCLEQCQTCQNMISCLTCRARYPFKQNNKCVQSCSQQFYPFGRQCLPRNSDFVPLPTPEPIPDNKTDDKNKTIPDILDQSFLVKDSTTVLANLYASNPGLQQKNVQFFLVNRKTGELLELSQKSFLKDGNKSTFELAIPSVDLIDYSTSKTNINGQNPQKIVSSKLTSQLITYQLERDPLAGLKWIGLSLFIATLAFGLLTKGKDHFSGQSANLIILHMLNFVQVTYYFKFTQLQTDAIYNFLDGFGYSNLIFFPSFFNGFIPHDYVQYPAERSLVPDGNLLRNAGFSFSYMIVVLLLFILGLIISFIVSKTYNLDEPPLMRKMARISFFLFHIAFLNILFFAFTQIIQPSYVQSQYQSFHTVNVIASIAMIVLIPLIMIGFIASYYFTYFGDVLEHYYSLRQASHFLLIYMQSIVLVLSIGKPLIGLFLIGLQLLWLVFNYSLYFYGNDDSISAKIKLFICSAAIIIAYVFLSLIGVVNWIIIIIIVSIVVAVLLIYSFWQVFILYFHNIAKVKDQISAKTIGS